MSQPENTLDLIRIVKVRNFDSAHLPEWIENNTFSMDSNDIGTKVLNLFIQICDFQVKQKSEKHIMNIYGCLIDNKGVS